MTLTDDQLRAKIEHFRGIHVKEIGMRVGEAIDLLEELLRLRQQLTQNAIVFDGKNLIRPLKEPIKWVTGMPYRNQP